jgi:hypothetical protein
MRDAVRTLFFQCRARKSMKRDFYVVALRMVPDAYDGAQGSPTNYMRFDIENAHSAHRRSDQAHRSAGGYMPAAALAWLVGAASRRRHTAWLLTDLRRGRDALVTTPIEAAQALEL